VDGCAITEKTFDADLTWEWRFAVRCLMISGTTKKIPISTPEIFDPLFPELSNQKIKLANKFTSTS